MSACDAHPPARRSAAVAKPSHARLSLLNASEHDAFLTDGDTLVVPALDRLSRSLQDLTATVAELRRRNIGFNYSCASSVPGPAMTRREVMPSAPMAGACQSA
ncbi:recombinase family protein [Krasilnikovia sp. M28-CT-15]|uniref:recombinase family protein n=1 Tax=Krasilnikovia sp. M28-CT-15 TaxID=3373540 RepID=UPI00399C59D1